MVDTVPVAQPRQSRTGTTLERAATVAGLLLLVAWPILARTATSNATFYITLGGTTLVSVILVTSLNMAMGYTGLLSVMHTGLLAVGGYAAAIVVTKAGLSAWLGLALGVVGAAAFGALVTAVSIRASYLYFGMITLAFNLFVVEVAREWESLTGGFFGLVGVPRPTVFGTALSLTQMYYLILVCAIAAYLYQRNLILSRSGRSWQAVRESDDTAAALGIRVGPAKVGSFTLASAMAGLAGGLFAYANSFVNPDIGLLDNGLVLFVGLLLGGIGTLAGPVLGVVLFAGMDFAIRDLAEYRRLVLGIILLAAMIIIPKGIVGTWRASRLGAQTSAGTVAPNGAPVPTVQVLDPADHTDRDEVVIAAEGVVKRFGGLTALDGVDLQIRGRSIHGIIGPNGSGKSTLIGCLTAYLEPDEGTILLWGEPRPRHPAKVAAAGVVRVFQVPHLFERVSVVDNVLTGMHMGASQKWWQSALRLPAFRDEELALRARARELLQIAGLAGVAGRPASTLSHGQKRLLEVVRAVGARPRVLILDEPATGLTRDEIASLADLIRTLQDGGMAIVLIEHNLQFVMDLCERLTVLEQGKVISQGSPGEVRASKAVQDAYLGPDMAMPTNEVST